MEHARNTDILHRNTIPVCSNRRKDYEMTREQIEEAFHIIVGMPPRAADVQIIEMMGGTPEIMAEYIWDHWMGEPDSPTMEQVQAFIESIIAE